MVGLYDIQSYFVSWYNSLIGFWEFLVSPGVATYLQNAADSISGSTDTSWIAEAFLSGIASIITLIFGADSSLLEILLGGSVMFYVCYQLLIWVLNIIT